MTRGGTLDKIFSFRHSIQDEKTVRDCLEKSLSPHPQVAWIPQWCLTKGIHFWCKEKNPRGAPSFYLYRYDMWRHTGYSFGVFALQNRPLKSKPVSNLKAENKLNGRRFSHWLGVTRNWHSHKFESSYKVKFFPAELAQMPHFCHFSFSVTNYL